MKSIDKIISVCKNMREDAPINSVGGGNIAGTSEAGDDPPVDLRKYKKLNLFYRKDIMKKRKKERKNKRKVQMD